MSMKKSDLDKQLGSKIGGQMKGAGIPGRFAQGALALVLLQEALAQAVHPGYGFLAENAEFAKACQEAGLVFVGPPVSAIDAMGDKIRAKETVSAAGVPVVPGANDVSDVDSVAAAADRVGYPILLKPSAGGGGGPSSILYPRPDSNRRYRLERAAC